MGGHGGGGHGGGGHGGGGFRGRGGLFLGGGWGGWGWPYDPLYDPFFGPNILVVDTGALDPNPPTMTAATPGASGASVAGEVNFGLDFASGYSGYDNSLEGVGGGMDAFGLASFGEDEREEHPDDEFDDREAGRHESFEAEVVAEYSENPEQAFDFGPFEPSSDPSDPSSPLSSGPQNPTADLPGYLGLAGAFGPPDISKGGVEPIMMVEDIHYDPLVKSGRAGTRRHPVVFFGHDHHGHHHHGQPEPPLIGCDTTCNYAGETGCDPAIGFEDDYYSGFGLAADMGVEFGRSDSDLGRHRQHKFKSRG